MKKFLLLLILLTFLNELFAQTNTEKFNISQSGFGIYEVTEIDSIIPFSDLLSVKNIEEIPILDENDILYYDTAKYNLHLNNTGVDKLKKINLGSKGKNIIIVINNEIISTAKLWTCYSSLGCQGLCFMYIDGLKLISINFPSFKEKKSEKIKEKILRNYFLQTSKLK